MGLEDRRKIKAYTEQDIPAAEEELSRLCGGKIKVEADWESFTTDPESLPYFGTALNVIGKAFAHLCRDELGQDAVKQGIQKVVIKNLAKASGNFIKLEKKILKVDWALGNGRETNLYEDAITKAIDKDL